MATHEFSVKAPPSPRSTWGLAAACRGRGSAADARYVHDGCGAIQFAEAAACELVRGLIQTSEVIDVWGGVYEGKSRCPWCKSVTLELY
jgi:hypothetical protein